MLQLYQNFTISPSPNLPISDKPSKLLTSPIPGGYDGESCKYGVYHSPQQFIKLAQNLVHPFDKQFVIPDILRLKIFNLITKGIGFVADVRTKSANLINKLSQELRFEEARYHASSPKHAQIVERFGSRYDGWSAIGRNTREITSV